MVNFNCTLYLFLPCLYLYLPWFTWCEMSRLYCHPVSCLIIVSSRGKVHLVENTCQRTTVFHTIDQGTTTNEKNPVKYILGKLRFRSHHLIERRHYTGDTILYIWCFSFSEKPCYIDIHVNDTISRVKFVSTRIESTRNVQLLATRLWIKQLQYNNNRISKYIVALQSTLINIQYINMKIHEFLVWF